MSKPSNRDKILNEGLRVVHQRGFANASVRDIVQAAGVPQGSFTNHFASKEAFGLEILDLYFATGRRSIEETLRNDALPPLDRLRAYIDRVRSRTEGEGGRRRGCLYGNFTAEASDHSEPIRRRLTEIFEDTRAAFAHCLRAAVAAGQARSDLDCDEMAGFIVSSLQGAILLSKAYRDTTPIDRCERLLLGMIAP